jgi:heptosyltransferase II
MKILVIALSGIGDALMFTPSLVKLKEDFPDSEIDALVMFKGVSDIYNNLPQISKVFYFDFMNGSKLKALAFILRIRKKYDATINVYPANRKEYNLISLLIGTPKSAAVRYLRKDFTNLGFLNNVCVTENDSRHNVEENILLCEMLSGKKSQSISPLQLNIKQETFEYADHFLSSLSINEKDLVIGFHPGCSVLKNHDKRRWEVHKFAGLGKKLIQEHSGKILIFGGPEEDYLKTGIAEQINSSSVIPINTSTLLETAALMKRCSVFVTNDSSQMHIAAALKLKVVAVIGPTNTNYIYPWQTEYKIASLNLDCAPCFYYSPKPLTCSRTDMQFKCIKELSVELVYGKVLEFLNQCSRI